MNEIIEQTYPEVVKELLLPMKHQALVSYFLNINSLKLYPQYLAVHLGKSRHLLSVWEINA